MDAPEFPRSLIRSSKKRGSDEQSLQQQSTANKRAALGEITNSLISSSSKTLSPDQDIIGMKSEEEKQTPRLPEGGSVESKKPASASASASTSASASASASASTSTSTHSIYQYLRSLEIELHEKIPKGIPNPGSARIREILVDWLVEVAEAYKLVSDTLYLTISHVDRYLCSHVVDSSKLQLVGVCCMRIASNYEEINPMHVEEYVYMTDNTYTKAEVLEMDRELCKFLNCDTSIPTIKKFLRIFTQVSLEDWKASKSQFEFLSCYLAELGLLGSRCIQILPSVIAASAIFLSRLTIQPEKHPWSSALQGYSGYMPSDLKECILAIHELQLNQEGSSLHAIRDKYQQHRFKCVAVLSPPSEIPAHYFEDNEDIDQQSKRPRTSLI